MNKFTGQLIRLTSEKPGSEMQLKSYYRTSACPKKDSDKFYMHGSSQGGDSHTAV